VSDVLTREKIGSLHLPLESLEPIVDEIIGLLVVASLGGEAKIDLIEAAASEFDTIILPAVRDQLEESALYHIEYTGLTIEDMVECLGGDTVAESLAWAVNVLTGLSYGRPDNLQAFRECASIDPRLDTMDDRVLASAVFYVFIAALNRTIANITF
jgi:citrate lyase beta subunit